MIDDPEWRGVDFVGIVTSDSRQNVTESGKLDKKNFLNLLDSNGVISSKLGVEFLPSTILLDEDGQIRYRVRGKLLGMSMMMLSKELGNIRGSLR